MRDSNLRSTVLPFALVVAVAVALSGCASNTSYEPGPPAGWQANDMQWWLPATDTSLAFRDLETLTSMGVSNADRVYASGVGMQQSIQKDNLVFAVKQSLIQIFRNEPQIVDSLFEAVITPKLVKARLSGDPTEDIKKFKREGYRSISRQFREPRTVTILGEDVSVIYPDSLAKAGISGSVAMQVYLDIEGTPQSVELLESVHPVLDDIAMKATTEMRWQPAYILRGAKSDPIPSWVRFSVGFRQSGG